MSSIFAPLALAVSLAQIAAVTPQHLPTAAVAAPRAALTLQIARTPLQRERGLMAYASLAPHTGMVFVFDTDAEVEFWMKDTLIPLDMIFVAADGTVRSVDANVPVVPANLPDLQIPIEQGTAKYVIELAGGEARADGIAPGVVLSDIAALK